MRQWDFASQGPLALRGPWQFYWQRLLSLQQARTARPTGMISIPGIWNGKKVGQLALAPDGYATYRLTLLLARPQILALRCNRLYSAYRLSINGKVRITHGRVGTHRAESTMQGGPRLLAFHAQPRTELLLVVANFFHRKGGPAEAIYLGTEAQLQRDHTLRVAFDLFLFAALLIIGFFYLLLHLMLRQNNATLFFALTSLCFALRILLVNESFLLYLFPQTPYVMLLRLEYLLTYTICIFSVMFLQAMFPKESYTWAIRGFQVYWGALMVPALLLSPWLFTRTWWLFFASIPLLLLYVIVITIRTLRQRRTGAKVLLLGNLLVVFGGAYDIWGYGVGGSLHVEIVQVCFMALIVGQAILLARLFSSAFATVERLAHELEDKNEHLLFMNEAASRFVPKDLLLLLGKDNIAEVQLSDYVHKHMAIMFSDIRGFTTISETMTAAENFDFVNVVMGRLSPIIRSHNGFVIKYLGDGMMAVFPGGVEDALAAANAKLHAVREYNAEIAAKEKADKILLKLGIGINYGSMMLGMVGELSRLQGDVLADAVNLAARVEGMTKRYQVDLLITDSAYKALSAPDNYQIRELDLVKPKGKSNSVTVYEVFDGDNDAQIQSKLATRSLLQQSIALYRQQDFVQAHSLLVKAQQMAPEDRVLAIYIERCLRNQQHGPTQDWDGIEVLQSK